MDIPIEVQGLGLDEGFAGERSYDFVLRCSHHLDPAHRIELDGLVQGWYTVSFHSGFGNEHLNQLRDLEYKREGDTEVVTFNARGALSKEALDVFMRCLALGDMDIVVQSVLLTVSDYPLRPSGALIYEIGSERRIVQLDGSQIDSKEAFMEAVASILALPDYFGRNWDALDECLRDLKQPIEIEWNSSRAYCLADPDGFEMAVRCFEDARPRVLLRLL